MGVWCQVLTGDIMFSCLPYRMGFNELVAILFSGPLLSLSLSLSLSPSLFCYYYYYLFSPSVLLPRTVHTDPGKRRLS